MAHPDPQIDLRACKQTREQTPHPPATSANGSSRPVLRLVPDATQTGGTPSRRDSDSAHVGGHLDAVASAVGAHTVTGSVPPTVVEAAADLWPDPDDVRYGLAEQIAAAIVGLAQVVGLAICWGAAHGLFATKTRTAIAVIVVAVFVAAYAIATHA